MTLMDHLRLAHELKRTRVDLARAALLLARELAYPSLQIRPYLAQLDDLAAAARRAAGTQITAQRLAALLFGEMGFVGNSSDYNDPRNSFLNEVLARRVGIPITLSVIYLSVARRLKLDAYGVSLPGHFVVGAQEGVDQLLLDPFNGGERLTLADCERLVKSTAGYEGPLHPDWLRPATANQIVARMLNNLRILYIQQEDWDMALAVIQLLHELEPDNVDHLRDLGLIHYDKGNFYEAATYLEAFMRAAPGTPEAIAIQDNLQPAFSRWARHN